MNFLENHYDKSNYSRYFKKPTLRPKIELNDNSKIKWVKKSELKCFVSFTCLRTCATNSWYFDISCSRHMTRNKETFIRRFGDFW